MTRIARSLLPIAAVAGVLAFASRVRPEEPPAPPHDDEGALALEVARDLASEPRPAGSPAVARARAKVARRLAAVGLVAREHAFTTVLDPGVVAFGATIKEPSEAVFLRESGRNLFVVLPGTGPAVLVSGHLDSAGPDVPGARDDAAACGVLVEVAARIARRPRARPIVLAFFEGEEEGLLGARAFARDAPAGPIAVALSLDVVGARNLALNGLGPTVDRGIATSILAAARRAGVPLAAPLPHLVVSRALPAGERSDHRAFAERGTPGFHLLARGDEGFDPCYHSPLDAGDRLDRATLAANVRLVDAWLEDVDRLDLGDDPHFLPLALPDPLGFREGGLTLILTGAVARTGAVAALVATLAALAAAAHRAGARAVRVRDVAGRVLVLAVLAAMGGASATIPFLLSAGWRASFDEHVLAGAACALSFAAVASAVRPVAGRTGGLATAALAASLGALALGVPFALVGVLEVAALPWCAAALLAPGALLAERRLPLARGLVVAGACGLLVTFARPSLYREGVLTGTFPETGRAYVVALAALGALLGPSLVALARVLPRRELPRALALAPVLAAGLLTARALGRPPRDDSFPRTAWVQHSLFEDRESVFLAPGSLAPDLGVEVDGRPLAFAPARGEWVRSDLAPLPCPVALDLEAHRDGTRVRVRARVRSSGPAIDHVELAWRVAGVPFARARLFGGGATFEDERALTADLASAIEVSATVSLATSPRTVALRSAPGVTVRRTSLVHLRRRVP